MDSAFSSVILPNFSDSAVAHARVGHRVRTHLAAFGNGFQAAQIVTPSRIMPLAGFRRQLAMGQPKPRAFTFWLQINFHPARSCRHVIYAPFKAPGEHHPRVSHDLEIFASDYVSAIWIDAVNSARLRIDFGTNPHPADHLCGISEKFENHRRRRVNIEFLDDGIRRHACPSSPPPPRISVWSASRPRMFPENSAIARIPVDGCDRAGEYPLSVPLAVPP